jgi:lipoyl(octanoyl) transferase
VSAPEGIGHLLDVLRLGRKPYREVHALQQELLAQRVAGQIRDTLILVEHDPVVTVGRGGGRPEFPPGGPEVIEVERGGEATYHGPGQVVAYPILALGEGRRDLHRYLRDLEQVVILALAEVQIEGRREPGKTGVWIGERKVASLGVAVRRWVTWHGLALNVHTDLAAFQGFRPCGLGAEVMTRVADHADIPPANLLFEVLVVKHLLAVFGLELPPTNPEQGRFPDLPILPS